MEASRRNRGTLRSSLENHKGKEDDMITLVAGSEWFVILPILCCGLPLLLLFFFGGRRGDGPKDPH
jgi:hypothetical protein